MDVAARSGTTSSRVSMASDDDGTPRMEDGEAYTMLQGVVSMNKVLEGQIEALRLRLQVEEKQHKDDKGKLTKEKDAVIKGKETEIEDLKDSLVNREERIQTLVRASEEKDRTIQSKVSEIDELKKLVKQTEDYAHKLHKQIGRVRDERKALETDTLYREQNTEIARLSEELSALKQRLSDMEQELKRAAKIIEEQNTKIKQFEQEKGSVQTKFREELDKATKAMRQEVERMREVMRQNYEEMRTLRDQNQQMHSDVKDIKELLMRGKVTPRYPTTGVQRPLTASPVHMFKPAEFSNRSPSPPKGMPSPKSPGQGVNRQPRTGAGAGGAYAVRQSVEPANHNRAVSRGQNQPAQRSQSKTPTSKALPPICAFKDEPTPTVASSNANAQRAKSGLRLSTGKSPTKK
nr:hypothetical protein BaRGS_033906 [Batillaria attramentaria]